VEDDGEVENEEEEGEVKGDEEDEEDEGELREASRDDSIRPGLFNLYETSALHSSRGRSYNKSEQSRLFLLLLDAWVITGKEVDSYYYRSSRLRLSSSPPLSKPFPPFINLHLHPHPVVQTLKIFTQTSLHFQRAIKTVD